SADEEMVQDEYGIGQDDPAVVVCVGRIETGRLRAAEEQVREREDRVRDLDPPVEVRVPAAEVRSAVGAEDNVDAAGPGVGEGLALGEREVGLAVAVQVAGLPRGQIYL